MTLDQYMSKMITTPASATATSGERARESCLGVRLKVEGILWTVLGWHSGVLR
jgi:hypothetical protein